MPWQKVTPVLLECAPAELCARRYPNHPRGCPNYSKKYGCPPGALVWTPKFFEKRDIYAIWNVFPFGRHVEKMRVKHPTWTDRQLANCLYWQGTARKELRENVKLFLGWLLDEHKIFAPYVTACPEAHGLNVTATMKGIGHELQWPPVTKTYQVAIAVVNPETREVVN